MKPYSKDLRIGVLAAVDRGEPREEVAGTFSVSVPTIKRWLKRRRETGRVEAIPIPGRPRVKGAALEGWLPAHLQKNHDLTLGERAYAKVPRNRGKNQTLIASITLEGGWERPSPSRAPPTPCSSRPTTSSTTTWRLRSARVRWSCSTGSGGAQDGQGQRTHRGAGSGARVLATLPPDLNPIEEAFGKTKSIVRKAGGRTRGVLDAAVGEALSAVTPEDAAGWFAYYGYRPLDQPL